MKSVITKIVGLIFLAGLGLIYGDVMNTADELKEQNVYSYMSFQVPNTESVLTFFKKVPESKCEKWRKDYFDVSIQNCNSCTVLKNACTATIPTEYLPTFEQKDLDFPYVYKPYKYPEVAIISGFPEGGFSQYCELEKQQLSTSTCIY